VELDVIRLARSRESRDDQSLSGNQRAHRSGCVDKMYAARPAEGLARKPPWRTDVSFMEWLDSL
jgi:hypothetical protein